MLCKHRLAVQIHCARVSGQPMPASNTLDGLRQVLEQRLAEQKPVLEMVRHDDGELSWVKPTADDRIRSQCYDDIFKRFEGD